MGVGEIGILTQYLASSHAVNAATASCYQHDCQADTRLSIDACWSYCYQLIDK